MNAENLTLEPLPRWVLMWGMAGALFFMGKAAMLRGAGLRGWRLTGFAFAWVGMDARPFNKERGRPAPFLPERKGAGRPFSLIAPLTNVALGSALLWGVARHCPHPLAAGWVGMAALILVLHFGLFGVLAGAWHALGVPVVPIMNFPVAATTLTEFWGRRWNLAFRDLAHDFVFRPVARRWGHKAAMWASFAVSGLAHELVISVPAGAGFGLPMGYFLLQALGISIERSADTPVRNGGIKADKSVRAPLLRRWLRTHAFTALPAILLFHPPFVERVMVPFFRAIGALP